MSNLSEEQYWLNQGFKICDNDSRIHGFGTSDDCESCEEYNNFQKIGHESIMYVCAFEVTRHYGGREEGGWWYNHEAPIASIPIKAIRVKGDKHPNSNPSDYANHVKPIDDNQVEFFKSYLQELYADVEHGNIYHSTGGSELLIRIQETEGEHSPKPRYE